MKLHPLITALLDGQDAAAYTRDLISRMPFTLVGTVTDNQDPLGQRRVKVMLPEKPNLQSHWIRRKELPYTDSPVPPVGSTVTVEFIGGNPQSAVYSLITNDTNPPIESEDPLNDLSQNLPASRIIEIAKDAIERIGQNLLLEVAGDSQENISGSKTVVVNENLDFDVLENISHTSLNHNIESTASLSMSAGASITASAPLLSFTSSTGTSFVLGGLTAGVPGATSNFTLNLGDDLVINCGGKAITLTNVGSFSINGKQVATVGAVDDNGDTIIDRGW